MNKLASDPDEVETIDSSSVFGPPPLIHGESAADYEELLHRIRSAVKPTDFIEQVWVRDVTDITWEILRLRRIKANLLKLKSQQVLVRETDITAVGSDIAALNTKTMLTQLDFIERFERMIATAEARRNAALRELDRHRSAVAERLRRAVDDVEDAKFEVVAPASPQNQNKDGEGA